MLKNEVYEGILNLPNLKVDDVVERGKTLEIHCHTEEGEHACVHCGHPLVSVNQHTERKLRDLDISGREVWLVLKARQFKCDNCGKYSTEDVGFAEKGKSYTRRQAKWIFEMCARQPFTGVACVTNTCAKTVENIYYAEAERRVRPEAERYAGVTHIGIDEIAHRKGRGDYCCVITNLLTGEELDILPDRKKSTIVQYFKGLGDSFCQSVKVVSCDLWKAYVRAAEECFPNAEVVLDRFHVVKLLNAALDRFRKGLRSKHKSEGAFKNLKWILFKQEKNCSGEQREQLREAFSKSKELKRLYETREAFHRIYDNPGSMGEMRRRLTRWAAQARRLGLACLKPFLKTLAKWMDSIVTFAKNRVTNAATEGLNNLIRYVKRISFGIPKFEHLRLRVLAMYT